MEFLGAGLHPTPAMATLVSALASARRSVAAQRSRNEDIAEWLDSEVKLRGVRENAAIVAALEVPSEREKVADRYKNAYPERANLLRDLISSL